MSGNGTPARRGLGKAPAPGTENPGWAIFSYMLSGMIFYGGVGWALGRWVIHSSLAFPIGMVVGLALAITLVILRYGRSGAA
jgi:ATP synthase protein I